MTTGLHPARSGSGGGSKATAAVGPVLVALAFIVFAYVFFRARSSADFMALWLAGESLAAGAPDLIYPSDTSYFSMLPPAEWITRLQARNYDGEVFPFIYPPIWAWLAAKASGVMRYETLLAVATTLNPFLIVATVSLAWRIAAPAMSLTLYLAIALVFLPLTSIGAYALFQNQPQILVAFLTLLAIERAEHGRPNQAGAVLALAAAIKLYPALYAVLWLAAGQRRAASSFAMSGAVLGGLSVALVGWPLHAQFLQVIGTVADTALLTPLSVSWESLLAQLFHFDQMITVGAPVLDPAWQYGYWMVLPKPAGLSLVLRIAMLLALVTLGWLFHRAERRAARADLWPFAFTLLTLLGPIGWSYYYLAAAAFIPMLAVRLKMRRGLALITLLTLGLSPFVPTLLGAEIPMSAHLVRLVQAFGTMTMTAMAVIFFVIRRRGTCQESASQNGTLATPVAPQA